MFKILKYYKPYTISIIMVVFLLFLQAMTDLALPDYMSKIIDLGIIAGNIPYIYTKGIQMVLLAFGSVACAALVSFYASRIGAKSSRNIRNAVFEKVSEFANPEFDHFTTASLITRSTNDIQQIQMVTIMMLRMVLLAPVMGIGALLRAYYKSPSLSWTIILALALILGIMLVIFTITMPKFKLTQKLVDQLNLVMNERLSGVMVIRSFNTEEKERSRFDDVNKDLTALNLFINRTMVIMMPIMMFIMNFISIVIIWVGSKYVDLGGILVGDMLAFMQYTMQIIISFLMISMVFIMLPRALVSVQRISEVLMAEPSILDPPEKEQLGHRFSPEKKGLVEFRNVSFRYPDADDYALLNISFTAKPGETTAFIGSTGSGKTTLVNLIPRFYDATEGEVLVEGINVSEVSQNSLRDKIGYVPQKGVLFSGTIESNLRYADEDAGEEALLHAAAVAQAEDFIREKPEGMQSAISQGGTNVSGGQKQRLSIARALVKKPDIYIFDDSFSALDFKTDAALRRALKEDIGDATVLIVAQRIGTIKNADQIIVLDQGNIVGIGTHKELMSQCQVYQEIALSQLAKEELA
ncbi:ABC transporter ATP-binding protein [Sinanaerobacter chloroacetimidivorans]|nr:ABC transporter ATP-binding protein [Sinanaerobacter chloroacetimidivorans]